MKEFKKPKYPLVLYFFIVTKEGDLPSDRTIIYNDTEEQNYRAKHKSKNINIDKLNKTEIKKLTLLNRIKYSIPTWTYWVIGSILGLLVFIKLLLDIIKALK